MSDPKEKLTDKQKEKLTKFRDNVKDVLEPKHDDAFLLRFLKARRFDLKKSEDMLRKDLKWREENKVDSIREWFKVPETYQTHWVGGVSGLDKEGHAVFVADFGNLDPKGLMYSAKLADMIKSSVYYMEELIQQQKDMSAEKYGHAIEGITGIIDLEHLGLHHLWKPGVDALQKVTVIMEQHYPEAIHRLYIVRAPKIFPIAYSLIKPFMRDDTKKKIQILGSNWKEELLKQIEPDQLPEFWGGTKTDPDGNPKCEKLIRPGGKVPVSYYLKDREPPHSYTEHEVSRGGHLDFERAVTKPSIFRYEFKTDSGEIRFGVARVESDGKKTPVLKMQKYNSHMVPEDGEIMIAEPGKYMVRFDNESWTKPKKLFYWMDLLEPSDVEPEFQEVEEEIANMKLTDSM